MLFASCSSDKTAKYYKDNLNQEKSEQLQELKKNFNFVIKSQSKPTYVFHHISNYIEDQLKTALPKTSDNPEANKEEQDKNINQFESVKKDILELFPNKQNYIDYKTTIKEQNAKQEKSKKGKVFKPPVWFEIKMKQEEYYRKCYREKIHKYYLSLEKNRSQTELDKIIEDVVIHKYNNHKFRN